MKNRRRFLKAFSILPFIPLSGSLKADAASVTDLGSITGKAIGNLGATSLRSLIYPRSFNSRRISSYDRSGGNHDSAQIKPGETNTFAEISGAGCISHIWITIKSKEPAYLRKLILRSYWDGESQPSIETPLGDFFGVGHGYARHYVSLPLNMITGGGVERSNRAAMNCYFPMPFAKGARFTLTNECDGPVTFYYTVNYEEYGSPQPDVLRFHAHWRRESSTKSKLDLVGTGVTGGQVDRLKNTSGQDNYVILDAKGRGQYVGCNLSVDNINPLPANSWFGEGDDMIFIDDDFNPTLYGTGTEDYFNAAWGYPSGEYSAPYHGVTLAHPVAGSNAPYSGKWTTYRFHIEDPVVFKKSIKVTIEHGHANVQANDYASTAYWYQTEPHLPFPVLPDVKDRLPLSDRESERLFLRSF